MKLTTKLIAITLMLAAATLAAGTGACTKDKCGYCEMTGTDKYCTTCVKEAIFGDGINRKCEGGTAITGCVEYKVHTDKTAYCSACESTKYLIAPNGGAVTTNKCVECDLTTKYVKADGVCTAATAVTDCAKYTWNADSCATCATGKSLDSSNPKKCVTTIANCLVHSATAGQCTTCMDGYNNIAANTACVANIANCKTAKAGDATKCSACNDEFHVKAADETCAANITKCKTGLAGSLDTKCDTCVEGYTIVGTTDTACVQITVANCAASATSKAADKCDTCKTGFALKADKTECSAKPTGCSAHAWDTTLKCYQCDTAGSYFATDVKGTATFTVGGTAYWEQVCTKTETPGGGGAGGSSSQIVAVGVMILAMISNF